MKQLHAVIVYTTFHNRLRLSTQMMNGSSPEVGTVPGRPADGEEQVPRTAATLNYKEITQTCILQNPLSQTIFAGIIYHRIRR